jgi:hypothetical protein
MLGELGSDLASNTQKTGTGVVVVMQTSPTLITPNLGTPASGNIVNCTGYVGDSSLTTVGTLSALTEIISDAATTTISTGAIFGHNSSGTPDVGFGTKYKFQLKDSTTNSVDAADITVSWTNALHSGTSSRLTFNMYSTGVALELLRLENSTGGGAKIGFLGAAATATVASPDIGSDYVTRGLATGTPTFAAANLTGYAVKSDQTTGTSTTKPVNPAVQQYHASAVKAWVEWDASSTTPNFLASYGVSSLTDNGVGDTTVNFTTAFTSTTYSYAGCCVAGTTSFGAFITGPYTANPTASAMRFATVQLSNLALVDSKFASVQFAGVQ